MCKFDQLGICKYKNKCYFSHNYQPKTNTLAPPCITYSETSYVKQIDKLNICSRTIDNYRNTHLQNLDSSTTASSPNESSQSLL